jgi:seryl-tRNA synthetase
VGVTSKSAIGSMFRNTDGVDAAILRMVGLPFEERVVPTLVDRSLLEKCGYFETFPHQLVAAGPVASEASQASPSLEHFVARWFLLPAACLPIYQMLPNDLTTANRRITAKVKVVRNEAVYDSLRLAEFTVREFVFVGSAEFVQESLDWMASRATVWCHSLGVEATIAPATDSFYPSRENDFRKRVQETRNLKRELLVPVSGKPVACASFNYHMSHFSAAFGFSREGQIVTGCAGFGLERWLAAIREWPQYKGGKRSAS